MLLVVAELFRQSPDIRRRLSESSSHTDFTPELILLALNDTSRMLLSFERLYIPTPPYDTGHWFVNPAHLQIISPL